MKRTSGFKKNKGNIRRLKWKIKEYRRHHFNYYRILTPSIINYKGKYLIAFRDYLPTNSYVRIGELVGNKIRNVKQVLGKKGVCSAEDPRFFIHRNKLHLSYVSGKWDTFATPGGYGKMAYCVLNDDLSVSENIVFDNFEGIQKNWLFFEALDNKLYAITYCHIQQVFDVKNNKIIDNDFKFKWTSFGSQSLDNQNDIVGIVRGGSTPILIDGAYYSFFHVTPSYKQTGHRVPNVCYEMGFYSFESSPPFKIIGYTPESLFNGNPYVLPNGAIYEKGSWVVSCGIDDSGWKLLEFNHIELLKKMVNVQKNDFA